MIPDVLFSGVWHYQLPGSRVSRNRNRCLSTIHGYCSRGYETEKLSVSRKTALEVSICSFRTRLAVTEGYCGTFSWRHYSRD